MLFVNTLLESVILQIFSLFGILFVFSFILAKLQNWTEAKYLQTVGWKGILWTAWIGTPIHELSHVLFAIIFRHKIIHISLFSPDKYTGRLGHVEHSYNLKSLYQRLGNFFVGLAPLLVGATILVGLLYFLAPNGREIFSAVQNSDFNWQALLDSTWKILSLLFAPKNFHLWKFWLFIYLSVCITTHISPSRADQKGIWSGFFWIVFLLLIINALFLLLGKNITPAIIKISHYFSIIMAILSYTSLIAIIHLCLISLLTFLLRRR